MVWVGSPLPLICTGVCDIDEFKVTVIDSDLKNAFAMPSGHVIVFTPMLFEESDDKLGVLLGNEISHVIAQHTVLLSSRCIFVPFFRNSSFSVWWVCTLTMRKPQYFSPQSVLRALVSKYELYQLILDIAIKRVPY